MKASLIINLIAAHNSGDENEFAHALEALASDEEKKGNVPLANQIRNTYKNKSKVGTVKKTDFTPISSTFMPQAATMSTIAPRDKDSMLELYELINPEVGLEEVILPKAQKEALLRIIEEQKNIKMLHKHNIMPSNRLLLCGPPGCGKTLTAKALAKEMGLPMAYVRLDGLVSSYLGQTSTNLRKIFDSVKNQRIVLFLDEFDTIAKKRDDSNELGELKRVVTTLLQNFDNMPEHVFLIAATNHHHLLDPAIWRRFNLSIILELPNEEQRTELIKKWIIEFKISATINVQLISKITEGLNGAQIRELMVAATKHYITNNNSLENEDVVKILIQQLTMFTENKDSYWAVLKDMHQRGVSLRSLEKATGIKHSTIQYRVGNKSKNTKESENNAE